MTSNADSVNHAEAVVVSPEVSAFMEAKRTPRARATRKIESVARRLLAGESPLDRARSLWVCGAYARGAPHVGDVDLLLEIDEPREPAKQAIDAYYRRAHRYAEVVKALGCGGGSIVTLAVTPLFQPAPAPISRERAQRSGLPPGHEFPHQPLLQHTVTGDPFGRVAGSIAAPGSHGSGHDSLPSPGSSHRPLVNRRRSGSSASARTGRAVV